MSEVRRSEQEPARDVLAAEAFAVPGADPSLHPGPIQLPEDPTGIEEPHDVLAAEEFPMPAAPRRTGAIGLARRASLTWRAGLTVTAGALLVLLALRLLRRR
jgi:hypothetical protein